MFPINVYMLINKLTVRPRGCPVLWNFSRPWFEFRGVQLSPKTC